MLKAAIVIKYEVLFRDLPGGTEEIHEKFQSGYPVSGQRYEFGTF
jgi:hypothetical protein